MLLLLLTAGCSHEMAGQSAPVQNLQDLLTVTFPSVADVPAELRGAKLSAPTLGLARGIADGFAQIGKPFVYGGMNDDGCRRTGGQPGQPGQGNACQGTIGFDPAGLNAFVLEHAGVSAVPEDSSGQRNGGTSVSRPQGKPGDIIGYQGSAALYLGTIHSVEYALNAYPNVHVEKTRWQANGSPADHDLHRWWQPISEGSM